MKQPRLNKFMTIIEKYIHPSPERETVPETLCIIVCLYSEVFSALN
jgi:hypothetical protein